MDDSFNAQSSEETAELEKVLLADAIGGTMYSRQWVLRAVMTLVSQNSVRGDPIVSDVEDEGNCHSHTTAPEDENVESGENSKECNNDALLDKLYSLVDMSVEEDVRTFLVETGCLQLILSQIPSVEDERLVELALCLVNKCLNSELLNITLEVSEQVFYSSVSPGVLSATFALLKNVCENLENGVSVEDTEAIVGRLMVSDFVTRLSVLLAASSNNDLLEAAAKFLFTLFELLVADMEDHRYESICMESSAYVSTDFLEALLEAFGQVCGNSVAEFHFLEALSHLTVLCTDHARDRSRRICSFLARYLVEHATQITLQSFATVSTVCFRCFRESNVVHLECLRIIERTFNTRFGHVQEREECANTAVKMNVKRELERFSMRLGERECKR